MPGFKRLVPHPEAPGRLVTEVAFSFEAFFTPELVITLTVDPQSVVGIADSPPIRTDAVWNGTCFGFFLKPEGRDGYLELAGSPSGAWAANWYSGYRAGRQEPRMGCDPVIRRAGRWTKLMIRLPFCPVRVPIGPRGQIGIGAAIVETDGTRSWWALNHPPGPPDLHHPDCFTLPYPDQR